MKLDPEYRDCLGLIAFWVLAYLVLSGTGDRINTWIAGLFS